MVWKRGQGILWVAVILFVAVPGAATGPEQTSHCVPDFTDEVLPYGTKVHSVFLSPGLHGSRLVYYLDTLTLGHSYSLSAVEPVATNVPDFDIVFETPTGSDRHAGTGDQVGMVPSTATAAYIYMPVGPDADVAPGNLATAAMGKFRFSQC